MILSLRLENWKSHSSSSFKFGKGTNILLGRMGSGKSSVLDALSFALYGTFPKMSRRDQAVENLVSMGSMAPYAAVALEFEKGGAKYEVVRRIGKRISDAEARLNGKLVQRGPKAVTDYIISVLGVDYELFTRAIYSEQNRIDYLLSLNPRARKQEIDWLLGLGDFDQAREAAQAAGTKLTEQSGIFAAEADPEKMQQASKKIAELESQKKEIGQSFEKLRAAQADLSSRLKAAEAGLSSLEKLRAVFRREQTECERLSGQLERLLRESEGRVKPAIGEIEALSGKKARAELELKSSREKARQLQLGLSSSKSNLAVAESRLKAAEEAQGRKAALAEKLRQLTSGKILETLEKELAEEKGELENMLLLHAALHAQEEELKKSVDALLSASAKCPVCDSDLSGGKAKALAEEKQVQIDEAALLAKKHIEEVADKRAKAALLEKSLMDAKSCQSELGRIASAAEDPADLAKKIAEAGALKDRLESELLALEKGASEIEYLVEAVRKSFDETERLERLFADRESTQARLQQAQQKLSSLAFDEQKYERAREEAGALRVETARAETEMAGEGRQLALIEEMLVLEKTSLAFLQEKAAMAKKYSEAAQSMSIYKNSLVAAQSEMRSALVEEINEALGEVWPAVYPYSDYSGVKIEADEKDYRLLMQKGEWLEVDAVASGGERACLCLALRISFATVLTPDVSWLILDEPTHNLDSDAVLMLSDAINTKIPSIVEQTFVITHDPMLGETGEGAVFRLERDKAKNEFTRVSLG